ncbi:hypothetical protein [Corallococcus exiguus]|uniref:Lipoprotein n=1 Tax=Corallococcus exiguus TaxID=83462 RepID=A0A7X4Y966_9BACT|nr:hypothetical protein [Corallococcus exiguus]NBC41244.1 hypothetical protein [Corallococcus exiguus]TNV63582.1 hypothetical protein FH620_14800 [Corallococcus exiguus]
MRVRNWGALVGLGLMLAGCGGVPEEDAALPSAVVEDVRRVEAQACPPGVAARVKVVIPPTADPGSEVTSLANVRGTLYLSTNLRDSSAVLWRSNGTDAGTVPVREFPPEPLGFPRLTNLVAVGDQVFFQLSTVATGTELWVSDGTAAGTHLVRDLTPGPTGSALLQLTDVGGRLVFFRQTQPTATEPSRTELWRSDGTSLGTVRVRDFGASAGLSFNTLKVGGRMLFFLAQSTGTTLWRTDGTAGGTTSVKRLDAGLTLILDVGYSGAQGLFVLLDGPNYEVWRTNGTEAGTARLDSFGRYTRLLGALGSYVYLWSPDAVTQRLRIDRLALSGGGKALVTTLPNPYANLEFATPYVQMSAVSANEIYFSMAINSDGPSPLDVSLWVTNGTAAGTRDLFRQLSRSDEYLSPVFATGTGRVLFSGSPEGGITQPWFTRGTVATTGQLAGPGVFSPDGFTRSGSRVYFYAIDDTQRPQLWSVPAIFNCPPGPATAL